MDLNKALCVAYGLSDCGTGTVGTDGNSAVPQSAESYRKGRKERVQTAPSKHKYAKSLCLPRKTAVYLG